MKLLILAKAGKYFTKDEARAAAAGAKSMPRDGDLIEFRSDRMTDKGPATGKVKTVKATVDGYYLTVEFADGQATLSWDDMGAEWVKPNLWLVKAIDTKYQRLLARRTDGTPEGMAAEDARLSDMVERCSGPAAVDAIRAADAEARAKVREDFGIEYASEGGYAAEVIDFHGLEVVIENPIGSVRAGIDPDGKLWATEMTASYGYISGTEGADGDMVDVFIGPDASSTTAYVARCQVAGKWGAYDEDKVMLGFPSEDAAREAFLQNYNDPRFLGGLDAMSLEKLKERLGKPGRLAKSLLIFTKAHVGPYLRGGKLVNLSGYQGRPARARVTAGQMGLFADLPPAEKPKRKKADDMTRFDHETTGDLFADADEHGEVPPGRRIMPRRDTVTESREELIAEHERLLQVLESPSHEDDKEEAKKQAAELAEYKQGAASKASETRARRRAVLDLLGEGWKAKAGSEGAKDAYSKNFKQPDGGRIEVTILPQRTVDGNFYVGSYQHGGKRPGAGGFKYAMSMEEAKAIAEDMGKTKPVLLFSGERKSANAQNSLTAASFSPKVEVSEPSGTARRESGAKEKKMSIPEVKNITFKIPENNPGPLAGKTLVGGVPARRVVKGVVLDAVVFPTDENGFDSSKYGKEIVVNMKGKPDLAEAAKAYEAAKAAAFEAAVPGISEILTLSRKVENDSARYAEQFERMMENEGNDGVRPPKLTDEAREKLLKEKLAANPRAAQYLRALSFEDASNRMKAAAGSKAKAMLLAGEPTSKAQATMDDWTGEKAKAEEDAYNKAKLRSIMTRENGWDVVDTMPEFFSPEWKALQADGYKMYMLGQNGQPIENALNGTIMAKPVQ